MALSVEPSPDAGWDVVAAGLDDLRSKRGFKGLVARGPRQSARPVPIYSLPAKGLRGEHAADTLLTSSVRSGWRYLIDDGDELVMVDLREHDAGLKFSRVRRGDAGERFIAALLAAETMAQPRRNYDLRILSFPGLNLEALWLAAKSNSRFVSLRGEPRPIDLEKLMRGARSAAMSRLAPKGAEPDLGGSRCSSSECLR